MRGSTLGSSIHVPYWTLVAKMHSSYNAYAYVGLKLAVNWKKKVEKFCLCQCYEHSGTPIQIHFFNKSISTISINLELKNKKKSPYIQFCISNKKKNCKILPCSITIQIVTLSLDNHRPNWFCGIWLQVRMAMRQVWGEYSIPSPNPSDHHLIHIILKAIN